MCDLKFLSFLIVFSCLFVSAQQSTPAASPASSAFQEKAIGESEAGNKLLWAEISSHRVAWVEQSKGKNIVRFDGEQQGEAYDKIEDLGISPDEKHVIFLAKRNSKWVLLLDGKDISPEVAKDEMMTAPAFQPQGTAVAIGACKQKKKCRLFVDGAAISGEFERVSYPVYSADGKRLAFMALRQKKWIAIVDGKEIGPEFLVPFKWGFSGDGKRFFVLGTMPKRWDRYFYAVDGMVGPAFEILSPISFSPDGTHYAYGGVLFKGGFNAKRFRGGLKCDLGGLCGFGEAGQETIGSIVVDGKSGTTYQGRGIAMMPGVVTELRAFSAGISTPAFDPAGALAYAVRRDGSISVCIGEKIGAGYDEILSPLAFSKDGQHFAYIAMLGKDLVEVRDNQPGVVPVIVPSNKEQAGGAGTAGPEVDWIALSPDGRHLAYEAFRRIAVKSSSRGGYAAVYDVILRPLPVGPLANYMALRTVVLDDHKVGEYEAEKIGEIRFQPESDHYCYAVHGLKGGKDVMNIDGTDSRFYDGVFQCRFNPDESVSFIAIEGQRILRVTYSPKSQAASQ